MSGSFVSADKRIAVFAGHEGPAICPEEARKSLCPVVMPPDEQKDCGCCLEHLEEQLWPLSAWSDEYLVVKAPPRGDVDLDTYRVQAGSDGVKLTTEPAIFGLHGAILAKRGDFIQVATDKSFHIKGSGPIQIAQYLSSMECVSDDTGDPAQIMAVAVSQYRDDYPFLVPAGYNEDWVTIVRPTGSTTDMDGSSVSGTFTPIASTGFEFGYLEVDAGPHRITGSAPFGLTQYGFFEATSYGNPAGLDLGGE